MLPNCKQTKAIMLAMFSTGKVHSRRDRDHIVMLLRLNEIELKVRTRGGTKIRLDSFIGWAIQDLKYIRAIKKVKGGYCLTNHGKRLSDIFLHKPIR